MWRILIVDDNFTNRKLIVDTLFEYAKCDVAATGEEALEAYSLSLEKQGYDLILLDIALPGKDGVSVLKEIRALEKEKGVVFEKSVPIIMVTAFKEHAIKAFSEQCDDYVVKPIDPLELIKKIKEKIDSRK